MTTRTALTTEQLRRSRIAAAAYVSGRQAALAAARRLSMPDRARARREELRSQPHSYEPRSDSRAFGLLDSDASLVRAVAYLAAVTVAYELIDAQTENGADELFSGFKNQAEQDWATATLNRAAVHEDAWRQRLTDNGIVDMWPGRSRDDLILPTEFEGIEFDDIAERTLDVSSTAADVEPIRLSDLMLTTPSQSPSSGSVIDITDRVAEVIEIDRGVGAEGGVDAW